MQDTSEQTVPVYEFNPGVQRRILAMMIFDASNFRLYAETVRPEYFGNIIFRDYAKIILDFCKKYGRPPVVDELAQQVGDLLVSKPQLSEAEYFSEFDSLLKIGAQGAEYVRDLIIKFAKHQAMQNALMKGADILKTQNDDNAGRILKLVENAVGIGTMSDNLGTFYFDRLDERILQRELGANRSQQTVRTGIPIIDEHMDGGLMRTELGIIMGPMKRGKTLFVMNLARNALIENVNVLHIVLEMSEVRLEDRYDSLITGIPRKELKALASEVKQKVDTFYNHPGVGKLVIKHFPAYTATVQTMENCINRLRTVHGFVPGLVIVDYLGLIATPGGRQNKVYDTGARYNIFGDHTKELISIAQKLNMAIWLVHQTTRGSLSKSTVQLEDSADSIQPLQDADVIITLNQKAAERRQSIIRLFIAGGRDVEDKKYAACRIDYRTGAMTPLSEAEQAQYNREGHRDAEPED